MEANFVVIGGGIAGVSCAETLSILDSKCSVILISESALIKTAVNILAVTKTLTSFEVKEDAFENLCSKFPNIRIIHDILLKVNSEVHTIETKSHLIIKYDYLCICTGAFPKLIPQATIYPEIIGIRDTDSVEILIEKLSKTRKIAIVGNGGIATELIYQIKNMEIHWIIKDKHISSTFVDPGAAEFFESALSRDKKDDNVHVSKRMRYSEYSMPKSGAALGPDWYRNLCITGIKTGGKEVVVHYETEVQCVNKNIDMECLEIMLTSGKKINCDAIISATGVKANLGFTHNLELTEEGFIKVDEFMKTSLKDVYAAGDVCSADWEPAKHWFQMKLWTQARQMGCYAAKCMLGV
ncbi:hypothetical protein WA026_000687 [Henosepilachna vigintioctopunctata]|uniref:FAD/NAD(P)-binding domain-containing protein n=1 Tax=Henosepilachna vigintioctopunctata TaxID=420089 RepID=A0AAW1UZA6_9CUCU